MSTRDLTVRNALKLPDIDRKLAKYTPNPNKALISMSTVTRPTFANGNTRSRKASTNSNSNLSDSFLESIQFKRERSVSGKKVFKPDYSSIASNQQNKTKKIIKVVPRDRITNLNEQTIKIIKLSRKKNMRQEKFEFSRTDFDTENSFEQLSDYNFNSNSKYTIDTVIERSRLFEIPSHSVLKFLSLVSRSKWSEAAKLCRRFVALQPSNQKYKDYLQVLESLVLLKEQMKKYKENESIDGDENESPRNQVLNENEPVVDYLQNLNEKNFDTSNTFGLNKNLLDLPVLDEDQEEDFVHDLFSHMVKKDFVGLRRSPEIVKANIDLVKFQANLTLSTVKIS